MVKCYRLHIQTYILYIYITVISLFCFCLFILGVHMIDRFINIDNILNIIFKITAKSPQILADFYLRKDISILSRWRNGSIVPKTEDLKKIVEFVLNESTEVQRFVIKEELINLLNNSSLKQDIKNIILEKETFKDFLVELLSLLTIECNLSEQTALDELASNKISTPEKHIDTNETYHEKQESINVKSNISGNYTGILKFDLSMQKNDSKISIDSESIKDIDIKNVNKQKKQKFFNKLSLLILFLGLTSFFLANISHNKSVSDNESISNNKSNTNLGVAPSLATPAFVGSEHEITSNTEQNKVEKVPSSPNTHSNHDSASIKVPTVAEQKKSDNNNNNNNIESTPSSQNTNKKGHENKSKSISDSKNDNATSNNDVENFNNNINIDGSNNNIAIGSSTIILEGE